MISPGSIFYLEFQVLNTLPFLIYSDFKKKKKVLLFSNKKNTENNAVIFSSLLNCLFCCVAVFKGQLLSSYNLFLLAFWSFFGKPNSEAPPQLLPESSSNFLCDISLKKVDFWLLIRNSRKKIEPIQHCEDF